MKFFNREKKKEKEYLNWLNQKVKEGVNRQRSQMVEKVLD